MYLKFSIESITSVLKCVIVWKIQQSGMNEMYFNIKVPICVVEQHFHLIAIKKNITLLFYTEPLLVFNDPSGLLALILGGYINDKNEYMDNIIFKLQLGVASINVCFVCLCKILNIMRRKTQTSPPPLLVLWYFQHARYKRNVSSNWLIVRPHVCASSSRDRNSYPLEEIFISGGSFQNSGQAVACVQAMANRTMLSYQAVGCPSPGL